MKRDMEVYASDRLSDLLDIKGFQPIEDVKREVEDLDGEFDGESYCPYYREQVDVIDAYEREFGADAEDYLGDTTYSAADWKRAQTAYAYAIAYAAFSHYFETAKRELIEGLDQFESDAQTILGTDEVQVQVSGSSVCGWAAHNRELEDGTMVFESHQLDGANGIERKIGSVWVSCIV